ncbi:hypothetical protein ANTPLA_LOCUS7446 [Anthophora plagiata]
MSRKAQKCLKKRRRVYSTDDIKIDNDRLEETEKEDDKPSPPVTEIVEEPPKRFDTNVVYTFQDLKAASLPPPSPPSVDAAVSTNLKEQESIVEKNGKEESEEREKKDEIKDEEKSDEKPRPSIANEICDEKTCAKEKCSPDTCEKPPKKSPPQSQDKIVHMKLTEMINSSIKEAMQTIVKQCRMVFKMQGEERDNDEKAKAEYDKTVCVDGKEEIPGKLRYEHRPRTTQDQLNDRSRILQPKRLQEKYKNVHSSPKKFHDKKGDLLEEIRNKRHAKSANNVKTDNRRMTGNVNIYICSEANENAQQSRKQKKAETCTESSSDTTTEHSKVSSSKLVTCIRNKRRKSKEQNFVDCLAKKEENSDDSTVCTCISKYTDSISEDNSIIEVCSAFNKDVCAKNIESLDSETLTDSECTETNIKNVQLSLDKPKFVLCDQIEKPCSTIYPMNSLSNSDSEGWSSKSSSRNAGSIPADKWSLELNLDHSNTYMNNLKRGYPASEGIPRRNVERICLCQKKDRESTGRYTMRCNCRNRKRSADKTLEQEWPICNCITEEEEEDVCVDASKKYSEGKKEMTICRETLIDSGEPGKLVPCTDYSAETGKKLEEEKEKEEIKDTEREAGEKVLEKVEESEEISTKTPRRMSLKLVRPEAIVLKNILKQEGRQPAQTVDQKTVSPAPLKKADTSEQPVRNGVKTTQDILKRFNIPEEYKILKKIPVEEEQTLPDETSEKLEEKKGEDKETKEDKGTKNLQGKTKETSVFKRLKKIIGKSESPETKDGKVVEDKINEAASNVGDVKNVEKTNVDGDHLPAKDNETKGAHKEKEKFNLSKFNPYKTMKNKKEKSERNPTANSPTIKEHKSNNKTENVTDASIRKEDTQETNPDVNKETQNKSKESPVTDKKNSPELQQAKSQNSPKQSEPQKMTKSPTTVDELPKRTKLEEKVNVPEKEKADPQEEITTPSEKRPIRKLPINEMKESSPSQYPQHHKIDSHTICVNSKYQKSSTMNESYHSDGSVCNCCYSSMSEYTNEPINYPKSCLKKDRTSFYQHVDSQRSHFSLPYRDKRNWEDCCCRRIISCKGCCRPRNDTSCRMTMNCTDCYKPRNKCNCKPIYDTKNICECMKSMFCLYCDKPREKCICRAPVAKCSCCDLAVDLCTCKEQKTICDGRPVLTEPENDRTMYVTAWKPREEIRRYFSRNLTDLRADPINEHCCCEKLKPHNSDDLPYQRLSVFSDVMDELQQKMSESTCCTRCRKMPCCCNIKADRDEVREERKIKYCISPKTRRKIIAVCMEKSKSKLLNNCKCDTGQGKNEKQKKIIVTLCCACKATPCRCKKSKSSQKKPKAKCYYCKNSPCVCITARERNKSRPCRCTDSPCRTMEKESIVPCGKISTKPKNNDEKTICMR